MSSYPNAVSPTANGNQWSSVVIEDLLVREFLNGENVAHLVPPTPSTTTTTASSNTGAESDTIPAANPAKQLREANKAFVRYLRGGGISWTASGTPSAISATPSAQFPSPAIKSTPATPYHKSPSPTPNSSAAANHQHRSFPQQQQGGAYNAPTPTSAPTVPTSPANGLVPMKSPHGAFPLSSSAVNTQHSPKNNNNNNNNNTFGNGGASNNKMALTVTKPGGGGNSSSMFPNQQSQNLPYSTVMGAVAAECSRVHTNFPPNIPNNTAMSTGKRRPHDDFVRARIHAQDTIDPDLIFAQPRDDFPLEHIFKSYPKVLAKMAETRGMSGDWIADTFTLDEEMKYKEDMGYTALGLSQTNSSFFASGM